jgi:hypothetical protein
MYRGIQTRMENAQSILPKTVTETMRLKKRRMIKDARRE